MKRVLFRPRAARDLERLPNRDRDQVEDAIERFAQAGSGDVKIPLRTRQIAVARLIPLDEFRRRMDQLAGTVKSSRPAAGYDEVLVAGDPEWRLEAERRREGIALDAGVWTKLTAAAARAGVDPPPCAMLEIDPPPGP